MDVGEPGAIERDAIAGRSPRVSPHPQRVDLLLLVEDDAITPRMLSSVQGLVGLAKELARGHAVARLGDAGGNGHRSENSIAVADLQIPDRQANLFDPFEDC